MYVCMYVCNFNTNVCNGLYLYVVDDVTITLYMYLVVYTYVYMHSFLSLDPPNQPQFTHCVAYDNGQPTLRVMSYVSFLTRKDNINYLL